MDACLPGCISGPPDCCGGGSLVFPAWPTSCVGDSVDETIGAGEDSSLVWKRFEIDGLCGRFDSAPAGFDWLPTAALVGWLIGECRSGAAN